MNNKNTTSKHVHDMEQLIKLSVEQLISDVKKSRKDKKSRSSHRKIKRSKSPTSDYFSTFDVPVKSNLIVSKIDDKFSRFTGGDKDPLNHSLEVDHKKRPPNADGMDSSLASVTGDSPGSYGGWGNSPFGTLGFGESINNQKSNFLQYLNSLHDVNTVDSGDLLLSHVVKGYKTLFDDMERKSTAIIMGIQPSLSKYVNTILDDFAFALNNFMGDVICIYIGDSNGLETIDDMKTWYKFIGVDDIVVDRIKFIEKSTSKNDFSMIDLEFNGQSGQLDSIPDVLDLVTLLNNVILVGCFDLYFAVDFMACMGKLNKKFEVDKRFSFMVE